MSIGMKSDNKRSELHSLEVKHVYNLDNIMLSDCHGNCLSFGRVDHSTTDIVGRRIVGCIRCAGDTGESYDDPRHEILCCSHQSFIHKRFQKALEQRLPNLFVS
ncbi:hypothetical protein TNCV_4063531 [Trichonephila clavipes]|nr:hypothetical protein TNCV_4063531 [Trichonephila clavipes]